MLTGSWRGDQVKRTSAESIGRAGQRTHGANLNRVAREIRLKRLVFVDTDLLERATIEHFNERVARNLLAKARATCTQNAPFAIEQDLRRNVDRLFEGALETFKTRFRLTITHRLVLQWAFPALVTHRAIQWVVNQEQFHDTVLCLFRNR